MKIKSIIYAVACTVLALASCDEVDKADRYIEVDTGIVAPPENPDDTGRPTSVQRAVLIEDFTGQMCVNCPNAVPVIEQLEEAYPGKVVAVAYIPVWYFRPRLAIWHFRQTLASSITRMPAARPSPQAA